MLVTTVKCRAIDSLSPPQNPPFSGQATGAPKREGWRCQGLRSNPKGLALTEEATLDATLLLSLAGRVLSPILVLATDEVGCLPYPLWGWRYGNGETSH